jgi:hypothetical protein
MLEIKPEERYDISEIGNELNKNNISKNILEGLEIILKIF